MENIKNETLEFLWYSYFGVSISNIKQLKNNKSDESNNKLIKICAKRAYLDLARTLRFTEDYKKYKDNIKYEKFCDKICDVIVKKIDKVLSATNFDENHKNVCDEIKIKTKSTNVLKDTFKFTYGHAQKWLNMTLKYMWLMGVYEVEIEKVKDKLHVPIDNYIIKKAKNDFKLKTNGESWSTWDDYDMYLKYQKDLQEKIKGDSDFETAIEWENSAWIEIAETK